MDQNLEVKPIKALKGKAKRLYETAEDAVRLKNYKYAADMYRTVLKIEPTVLEARKKLREAQMAAIGGKSNFIKQTLANIMALPTLITNPIKLMRGKHDAALDAAEKVLSMDPTCHAGIFLLVRAAEEAELTQVAIQTLEHALEHHGKSLTFLDWAARVYSDAGMGRKVLECRQAIHDHNPNNLRYQETLRQAQAEAAMDEGKWEKVFHEGGDYRDLIRDVDEAVALEQEERAAKDAGSIDQLIERQLAKVAERDSVDVRRRLAELYAKARNHDKALEEYDRVIQMQEGVLDPVVDEAITTISSRQFDETIREWEVYAESDVTEEERASAVEQVETLRGQKRMMLIERLSDRVRRLPNSVKDRFALAKNLFTNGDVDEALTHFQHCQKKTQFKLDSTMYMGQCFMAKQLYDLAIDEFQAVIDAQRDMNSTKKESLYAMAQCLTALDRSDEALNAYKEIYRVDRNYRDVASIVESGG
jgi:tetratricopeptide (TPR) repeat protein